MVDPSVQSRVPLLETRLFPPPWRQGMIARPLLMELLRTGVERTLTLISAPAGFGKTTLLAEWMAEEAQDNARVTWLSIGESENDPTLFWSYIIASLKKVHPDVGEETLLLLFSHQPPPITSTLATLVNDLYAVQYTTILVLDDYHHINTPAVHEGMAFLLDHLPPHIHLVISSRTDLPFPIARMRARGELKELRAAELRFTLEEAAAFLNETMGLALTSDDVAVLEERTEGWVAGLQLAALSLKGRHDPDTFIQHFAGNDRYVADFLVEEVLRRQPESVRQFLLQTSILERLTGSLCDAVIGGSSGRDLLHKMEQDNLFVIPLDTTQEWYRYHHLFADVLRSRLKESYPDGVAELHLRASTWFEEHELWSEAITHALAARAMDRAADMIEVAGFAMVQNRQELSVLGWIQLLPDALIRSRPVISAGYASLLLMTGDFEAFESRLNDAEQCLKNPEKDFVHVNEDEFRRLPGRIAINRAIQAQLRSDIPGTMKYARQALEESPPDDHFWRGAAYAILGLTSWAMGDLEEAYATFSKGMVHLEQAGNLSDAISGSLILADIRLAQGRLHAAKQICEQGLQRALDQGEPAIRATSDLYMGLSELYYESNDLELANNYIERGQQLGDAASLPENKFRWALSKARLAIAQGNLTSADTYLMEAEELYNRCVLPDVRSVTAIRARNFLRQGRLGEAQEWVTQRNISSSDLISYFREFEYITLARVMLAEYIARQDRPLIQETRVFLDRLQESAEQGERTGRRIDILIVKALALQAEWLMTEALAPLEEALALAEPEGFFRIFVDEGEAMRDLLGRLVAQGRGGAYARQVLAAFSAPIEIPEADPLSVPLTARETEILRLIASGLKNQAIADQLFISLSTVKRHIANAYNKLDVTDRNEAVSRAEALNLL